MRILVRSASVAIFLLLCTMGAAAQGNTSWYGVYGQSNGDWFWDIAPTSDGGVVAVGGTSSWGTGGDLWIMKTDANGTPVWQKVVGGPSYDFGWGVRELPGGDLAVLGGTQSYGAGGGDVWIMRLGPTGNRIWAKTLGCTGWDMPSDIIIAQNGDICVCGYTDSLGEGDNDLWVFRTDSDGGLLWSNGYGGVDDDSGEALTELPGGDIAVSGYTLSGGAGAADLLLARFDSSGNPVGGTVYGGGNFDEGRDIIAASDGGLLVLGATASMGEGGYDAWLLKFTAGGALDWTYTYGTPTSEGPLGLCELPGGGYAFAGEFSEEGERAGVGETMGMVVRVTSSGMPVVSRVFGDQFDHDHASHLYGHHGDFVTVAATTFNLGAGDEDAWILNLDASLLIGDGCDPGTDWSFPYMVASPSTSTFPGSVIPFSCTVTDTPVTPLDTNALTIQCPEPPSCTLTCSASASPTSGPEPLAVGFYADATPSGDCSGSVTYEWFFGDGGSSTDQNPTHTYLTDGVYSWQMTAAVDGATCTETGTVSVTATSADVYGNLFMGTGGDIFDLNGPGVSGNVLLYDSDGAYLMQAPISGGGYSFVDLPFGDYQVEAHVTYLDHIEEDAWVDGLTAGCPAAGIVSKEVASERISFSHSTWTRVDIAFRYPIVLLHGILECYRKWYGDDPGDPDFAYYWDNYARDRGIISFTPNYQWRWWTDDDSWEVRAEQFIYQMEANMTALTNGMDRTPEPDIFEISPYVLVGHNMGGLLTRVLASGTYMHHPVVQRILGIYLLGTPNSGSNLFACGGYDNPLGVNTIIRRFNEVYPDFGGHDVFAVGGDDGWWNRRNSDGRVSLYSAFNVTRLSCFEGEGGDTVCLPYPSLTLDSGNGHVYFFSHGELGSPESAEAILQALLDGTLGASPLLPSEAAVQDDPDSPAGGITWGTTSRTTGAVKGDIGARATTAFSLGTVSDTDGIAVTRFIEAGSGQLMLEGPTGMTWALDQYATQILNPVPGAYTLLATPDPAGMAFCASLVENSPFGILAYLTRTRYVPSQEAELRIDRDGDWAFVTPGAAEADLLDADGSVLQTIPMTLDGESWFGTFTTPASPGSYAMEVRAAGTYDGTAFSRVEFVTLYVVQQLDLFTGVFADAPFDRNDDFFYDAVDVEAQLDLDDPGHYVVWGDLFDGDGGFISHASSAVYAETPGILTPVIRFPTDAAYCSQFSGPFQVLNLEVVDGGTLAPMDSWEDPVATDDYDPGAFTCLPGDLPPTLSSIRPDSGVQGQTLPILLGGADFLEGATVSFDTDVSVLETEILSANLIAARVQIDPYAPAGFKTPSVMNPDGISDSIAGGFEVAPNQPPLVVFLVPSPEEALSETILVTVEVSDDVGVQQVDFLLDGEPQHTDPAFPFQWAWDTTTASNGSHTLTATALDSLGLPGSASLTVETSNITIPGDCNGDEIVSIGEVQKAINMFLGFEDPACGVDGDGNGSVSVGEVQQVINAFLGG